MKNSVLLRNKSSSCSFQRKSDSKDKSRQAMATRASTGKVNDDILLNFFMLWSYNVFLSFLDVDSRFEVLFADAAAVKSVAMTR